MSYRLDKWTDEELVEHYSEMQHLPIDVSSSKGIGDLAFFHGLVREMARRFALLIENVAIEALDQEPTTKNDLGVDCISREAVERIINKWLSHSDYELKDHIYSMTKKIHNLPSVTPQKPKWIPVSERLPDTDDAVLCWYEYYHWSQGKVIPEYGLGSYFKETKAWFGEVANGKDVRVIAWMPLPEPYKRESE